MPLLELLYGEDERTFVAGGNDGAAGQIVQQIEAGREERTGPGG